MAPVLNSFAVIMRFLALALPFLTACSHGSPGSTSVPNSASSGPSATAASPRFRDVPAPPDLSNRRLIGEKTRVIGPKDPVLIRHQGQRPIVHVSGFYGIQERGVPVRLERSPFELAVFEDGILAFQGYFCGWGSGPTTASLSEPELAVLRELVGRECFGLRSSNAYCTHSGLVQIRCTADSRTMDLRNSCESADETRAWKVFANRVRQLLRIHERQPTEAACSRPPQPSFGDSEIGLTVSPWVIIDRAYE